MAPAPRTRPWSPAEFEARLRAVARERYHDRHPFNVRMHDGGLRPAEVRSWIANRFHYQRHIPVKDALITAKLDSPRLRRMWLRRIEDHDGRSEGEGGIERWLRLGEAAGLDRRGLLAGEPVLPGVRLAVEGYVNFCRLRPPLEAVAASLTELTAPGLMRRRIDAFERHYPWIAADGLAYFRARVDQGRRDSTEALALVLEWARTRDDQRRALSALTFKCEVLWALLDAVQQAAQEPEDHDPTRRPGRPDPENAPAHPNGTDPTTTEPLPDRPVPGGSRVVDGGPEVRSRPWRTAGRTVDRQDVDGRRAVDGGPEPDRRPEVDSRPWRMAGRTAGRQEAYGRGAVDGRPTVDGCPNVDGRRDVGRSRDVGGSRPVGGRPEADSRPWRGARGTRRGRE
jgi:pyrroloquinoline-quinone synthase